MHLLSPPSSLVNMARGASKRKIVDTIDLTGDENEPPIKSSKTAGSTPSEPVERSRAPLSSQNSWTDSGYSSSYHSSPYAQSQHSRSERDRWVAASTQEPDENALETVPSSNDEDNDDFESYELYGNIDTKIVGCRYYNGNVTVGEYTLVKREPSNPYDRNAIRIDNVMNAQIGHIGRNIAAKLAPFLDSRDLLVAATLTGEKGTFDCPIRLKLFGTSNPEAQGVLKQKMQDVRLPVNELIGAEKQRKKEEKEREAAMKAARKAMGMRAGGSQQIGPDKADFANLSIPGPRQAPITMDDILGTAQTFNPRTVSEVVDKLSGSEDALAALPMANQPDDIRTILLPYQRQGLQWMLDKESPELPKRGSKDTTQLWKHDSNGMYTNISTNFATRQQPQLATGGILADDMGLGKTIQVISLLVADPKRSRQPTLIVAPLSVMSNWKGQAEAHLKDKAALRTLTYHGAYRDARSSQDFEQYDLVITTYQTLAQEYMPTGKKQAAPVPRKEGLYSVNWRRIVLDEGHNIRNPKAKMTLAACAVQAISRWILTGTPIVNSLKDVHSHIKFLRLTGGLEKAEVFNAILMRPLRNNDPNANLLLQALVGTMCLRRMKDMKFIDLRLPELTSHKYPVQFLKHEQEKYDVFKSEAQGLLQQYQNQGQQKGDKGFSHVLEVLLRLRQTCNHWSLAKDRLKKLMEVLEENKRVDLTPENRLALQSLLQVRIESQDDCPICLEPLHMPVITACGHPFGQQCIERVIESTHKCPMCRAELSDPETSLVSSTAALGEDEGVTDVDPDTSSSKIEALIKILRASAGKAGTKTVVFSQWTSFLDLIEPHLKNHGLGYCRLDGKMNAANRDNSIKSLSEDPSCTIMLASLSVCSVGLNLVAASQVILADSWWAPAIEDQAVDRVHRLSQTRPVTVFRLVMEGSIEERVLEIQAKKRELASVAFREEESGRKKRGDEKIGRLGDIETLLRPAK